MDRELIPDIERGYISRLIRERKRTDGRGFEEFRPLSVEINPYGSAEGSARVKLGNTDVIVGIKMIIGEPYSDRPASGVLTTVAELRPGASEFFEQGPPKAESIELARVVDRGIRESGAIELDKLCIVEGEKVWVLFIDIHALDFDGNLIDAAGIAAIAALKNATVRASDHEVGDDFPLPVVESPIPVTVYKVGGELLLDANLVEETVAEARLTITMDEKGDIRAMQKGGTANLTVEEVQRAMDLAQKGSNNIRDLLAMD